MVHYEIGLNVVSETVDRRYRKPKIKHFPWLEEESTAIENAYTDIGVVKEHSLHCASNVSCSTLHADKGGSSVRCLNKLPCDCGLVERKCAKHAG